jgi:EAL domain-containing protein (putative c-di-GMP-specific phosphodiesterase class I)
MLEEELRLMPEVVRGIEEKEFVFYVQPKFSLSKQRVVGAEALVRWKHKKRGMIPPGQFIPVLEKNGYISKLDAYLWEQVAIQLREWIDKGYEPVPISVNVSRLDFYAMDVPEFFGNLVKKYRLDPKYIEIEITENSYVEDAEVIKRAENDFKHNGFSVLIDDFGSGYSSLNMLKDIHADILKLDMKFLDLNEQNLAKGEEIIKSVFDLSHSLRMPVIAEGVETGDQVSMLGQMGCDLIQGYYFYRPLPVGEFEELMKNEEKTAAAIPVKTAVNAVMARKINTVSSYFIKTAEVNLLTGEYQLINTLDTDDKFIADNTNTIAEYVKERQKYNIVHPDDGDCYFKCSDTKYILDQISDGKRRLHSKMRYFFEGEYRNALFEVTIPPEYSDENPWVLYSWKLIYDD